jgi:hypothetical protein
MGIVGDNFVAERPRLIAPELSIFNTDNSPLTIGLTATLVPSDSSASTLTLVPSSPDLATLSASLEWVGGVPKLLVINPNTWVGNESFTAIGKIDGIDVQIPLTLRNLGNNTLTVSSTGTVLEGDTTGHPLMLTLGLEKPAGETLAVHWEAVLPVAGGVNAEDFMGGIIPQGNITFERGEMSKSISIFTSGDVTVEGDEIFNIDFSIANVPTTLMTLPDTSETIVIKNDDLNNYVGTAKYWNNDKPLDLLTGWTIESEKVLSTISNVSMKNIIFDSKSGNMTAELWINSVESISNLDLHFVKPDGITVFVTPSANTADWTLIQNDVAGRFDMASIGNTGVAGELKLYDLLFSNFQPGQELQIDRGTVGNTMLMPTNFKSAQAMTIDNGVIALSTADKTLTLIDFTAPASTQSLLSIDSRDALIVLKMANGTLPSNQLVNPLQWVAADVNQSGVVSALDAWHILREIVGLGTASVGDWQMVDASVDTSTLSTQNAWLSNLDNIALDVASGLDLIGIIRGDVDGSWGVYPL